MPVHVLIVTPLLLQAQQCLNESGLSSLDSESAFFRIRMAILLPARDGASTKMTIILQCRRGASPELCAGPAERHGVRLHWNPMMPANVRHD
jgi:hypothetical protein